MALLRPQAHVASGLLVWSAGDATAWEAPLCALAANLPDLDRSVARRLGVRRRDHHRWVSHSAVGWAVPTVLGLRLGRRRPAVLRLTGLVWVHLLLDTYADGLAWLWPLSEEKIGLFRKPPDIHDAGWRTPAPAGTALGRLERAMWALTAVGLVRRRLASR